MMLEWLLNFSIMWISVDIVIFATVWYLATTIKPRYPNWWKRIIADNDPNFYQQ